jgi:hypothetical protein
MARWASMVAARRILPLTVATFAALVLGGCDSRQQLSETIQFPPEEQAPVLPAPVPPAPVPPPPTTGTATLRWSAPTQTNTGEPLTDLAGYRVYYGQDWLKLEFALTIGDPTATSGVITGLSQGTWYFAVTAFTEQGVESAMSNTASKHF